jgi:hypothetical protein
MQVSAVIIFLKKAMEFTAIEGMGSENNKTIENTMKA